MLSGIRFGKNYFQRVTDGFYNPNASKMNLQTLESSSFGVEKRNKHIIIYSIKTRVTNTIRKAYAINKNLQLIFSIIESIDYDRKKYQGIGCFFSDNTLPKVKFTVPVCVAGIQYFRLAHDTILQFFFFFSFRRFVDNVTKRFPRHRNKRLTLPNCSFSR